ncbi:MAG: hypothetical protein QM811_14245 [Pirellulales bacterium]
MINEPKSIAPKPTSTFRYAALRQSTKPKGYQMNAPTRLEISDQLHRFLNKELSRSQLSGWANHWLLNDENIEDPQVWKALELMGAAELPSSDRAFLYLDEDYSDILQTIQK